MKTIKLLITLVVVLVLAACGSKDANDGSANNGEGSDFEFLRIATGSSGGTWPTLGTKLAEIANDSLEGVSTNSLLGGGTDNIINLEKGEVEMGITTTSNSYKALNGEAPFEKPTEKTMHVMTLYPLAGQFVVPKNSNLNTPEDLLSGEYNINAGYQGSTTLNLFNSILSAYDITIEDIENAGGTVSYLQYQDGMIGVQDGQLQLTGVVGPPYHNVITQLSRNPGVKFLSLDEEHVNKVTENVKGFFPITIKPGTYDGIDEPVVTIGEECTLIASSDVPEEVVYDFLTAVFENVEDVQSLFAAADDITLERAVENRVFPLHPGAEKFFKEKGLLKE